jgi:hypothetical protein
MRPSRKSRVRYPGNTSSLATARDRPRGRAEIVLGVAGAIVGGELIGDPSAMPRGTMRHAVHRVAARHEQPEQRVAALVVGGALAIDRVEQDVARGPERDLLHGLGEVPAWTSLWPLRAARKPTSKSGDRGECGIRLQGPRRGGGHAHRIDISRRVGSFTPIGNIKG